MKKLPSLYHYIADKLQCSYNTAYQKIKRDMPDALNLKLEWLELKKQEKQIIREMKTEIKRKETK